VTQQLANLLYLFASTLVSTWILCGAVALSLVFEARSWRLAVNAFTVAVFAVALVAGLVWRARGGS